MHITGTPPMDAKRKQGGNLKRGIKESNKRMYQRVRAKEQRTGTGPSALGKQRVDGKGDGTKGVRTKIIL